MTDIEPTPASTEPDQTGIPAEADGVATPAEADDERDSDVAEPESHLAGEDAPPPAQ